MIVWKACEIHFIEAANGARIPVYQFFVDMEKSTQRGPGKMTSKIIIGRARESRLAVGNRKAA